MPEVYLSILAPAAPAAWTHALIGRKRCFNAWWQSRLQQWGVVNQAGQWALPGGRIDPGEFPVDQAKKEFKEETGLDLTEDFGQAAQQAMRAAAQNKVNALMAAAIRASPALAARMAPAAAIPLEVQTDSFPPAPPAPPPPVPQTEGAPPPPAPPAPPPPNVDYHLVVLRVAPERLQKIRIDADRLLKPRPVGLGGGRAPLSVGQGGRGGRTPYERPPSQQHRSSSPPRTPETHEGPYDQPFDISIRDWEFSGLEVVARQALCSKSA